MASGPHRSSNASSFRRPFEIKSPHIPKTLTIPRAHVRAHAREETALDRFPVRGVTDTQQSDTRRCPFFLVKDGVIGRPSLWIAERFWVLRFRLMVKRGPLL
jgi:hypothetical protein